MRFRTGSSGLSERFVDAVVADGWLATPADLLSSFRSPPGRVPSDQALGLSRAFSRIGDADALAVISAVQDATYFAILNLVDAECKDASIKVLLSDGTTQIDPSVDGLPLHEIYRRRVEPGGVVRTTS